MGLDAVELVMDAEEAFGIEIPDEVAERIVTVGDLFEFIKSQTELAAAGTCLTAATFYDIRRAFEDLGISERFGPSTQLDEIVPDRGRRSFWAKLSHAANLKFPNLVRPSWVVGLNIVVTFAGSLLTALIASGQDVKGTTFAVTLIACFFIFGWFTAVFTKPFATRFGPNFKTFRSLSECVLALNASTQQSKHGPMGPNDIWVVLRELIVTQFGVDADEVTPDANFVKDLGLN